MANIKEIVLKKKIGGILYDLMVKTNVAQVQFDDETTLAAKLQSMLTDISDAKDKLSTLIGDDEAGSITSQISAAVKEAVDAINNEEEPTSVAGKIKAVKEAVDAINNAESGILATAKAYTDGKIGDLGVSATVKEYVDAAKNEVTASLAGAFHFKGTVDFVKDLADIEDPGTGDVYQVKYRGEEGTTELNAEYAYNGTEFIELGSIVDLSAYSTTEQVTSAISSAVSTAKSEIEGTMATDKTELEGKITAAETLAKERARFLVAAEAPEDLTENDIFAQIVEA